MEPPPSSAAAAFDPALHALGFQYVELSPKKVTGRFEVTKTCCQPFNVLHGGVSALAAESLASAGALFASGFRRVAGVSLCINHLRPARLGDLVLAEATPLHLGKTIQVWDVNFWIEDPSASEKRTLISTSRVTLHCNLSESLKVSPDVLKKYAKL